MPDPLFGPEIRDMLAQNDTPGLRAMCEELHPATLADVLTEFSPEQVWQVIGHSEIRQQASIFEYLPATMQEEMASGPHRPQVAQLLGKMSHDDRVDLLHRLPKAVNESLLRLVDEADRRDIKTLFQYGENTVGAIMTTDYAWLPPTLTAAEAVDQLRQQAPDRETIYYIYVLDETRKSDDGKGGLAPRKLLGVISLRDLILAPRHVLLKDIANTEIVALPYMADREEAAALLQRYDFIAVPVVDEHGRMLGIVTHDDAIDVITQEATEDMQRQAGVAPLGESYMTASFYRLWRSRAFWLAALFIGELATSHVLEAFEGMIATLVVLSLFIPLCISTGGNSGAQASTLVTRALALGEVKLTEWRRLLRRELLMGIALGLSLGGIAFARGAITGRDTRGGPQELKREAHISIPKDQELQTDEHGDYIVPVDSAISRNTDRATYVRLKNNETLPTPVIDGEKKTYTFPAGSESRVEPISRWQLGTVLACAVLFICLWGTLIGATLPLIFKRLGLDPAIASGPFVATAVDVTGIAIYCALAMLILL